VTFAKNGQSENIFHEKLLTDKNYILNIFNNQIARIADCTKYSKTGIRPATQRLFRYFKRWWTTFILARL